jgi:hypothetical protein
MDPEFHFSEIYKKTKPEVSRLQTEFSLAMFKKYVYLRMLGIK